jgi:hypothetical protein
MSNYSKLATETTDQFLATLAEGQENFLKSLSTFSSWVPASPTAPPPAFSGLPTAQEIVEANFTFAQKLLRQQQDFTQRLIAATELTTPNTSARSAAAKSKAAA